MGYLSISVREAMDKILNKDSILRVTQRPYVWGDRYQSEEGIYRLLDSLYRNIQSARFCSGIQRKNSLSSVSPELRSGNVPAAACRARCMGWSKIPYLRRPAAPSSRCIRVSRELSHHQVLCFDLAFELDILENPDTFGFMFNAANAPVSRYILRLNMLYEAYRRAGRDGMTDFRRSIIQQLTDTPDDALARVVERNIEKLWRLFNDETNQICGYFTIPSDLGRADVQEIFVRLNSGGIQPSQADLVFSMIHTEAHDFQARIQDLTEEIQAATHIEVSIYDVLQILNFVEYNTPRIDLDRIRRGDVSRFSELLGQLEEPIKAFYKRFLHDEFNITSSSIYRSQVALLPLLLHFHRRGIRSSARGEDLMRLKQYFIISQINDWSIQGIVSRAAALIEAGTEFPLEQITAIVRTTTRSPIVTEQGLRGMPAFALKVLLPKKAYTYIESRGRLNPELEHIFPLNPRDRVLAGDIWGRQVCIMESPTRSTGRYKRREAAQDAAGVLPFASECSCAAL